MRLEGNRKLPVNITEGNFDDELYVAEQSDLDFGQDVNRTPERQKSGLKRTLVEECEDEAAERKAKGVKLTEAKCILRGLSWP